MKRPGAEYFLEQMAKYFEVVIYTASLSKVSTMLCSSSDHNFNGDSDSILLRTCASFSMPIR